MANAPLIYLFGYPGVGKNTVAKIIESKSDFIAVQNHLISNAFRHVMAKGKPEEYAKLEKLVMHHSMKAWLNFLDFVEEAAPRTGLVFTSVLYQNDSDRAEFFEYIANWALAKGRAFYPVRLTCARDEILRRAASTNRNPEFKLTDPAVLAKILNKNTLLQPDHPNFIEIDTTTLSAADAAAQILARL
jgi:adenylate kinase family enzyme